jgi:hypothetical protein
MLWAKKNSKRINLFAYLLTTGDVTEEAAEGDGLGDGGLQRNIEIVTVLVKVKNLFFCKSLIYKLFPKRFKITEMCLHFN